MLSKYTVSALILFAAITLSINGQTTAPRNSGTITVNSRRPLNDALDRLQQMTGVPINYEEAPLQNPAYLEIRTIANIYGEKTVSSAIPEQFTVTFTPEQTTPFAKVQAILQAYEAAGLPGDYDAIQNKNQITVFPVRVGDAKGNLQQITPVMNRRITFPSVSRNAIEALNLIADTLSKEAGVKVFNLTQVDNGSLTITLGANDESGAEVLNKIDDDSFSYYRLLYDPSEKAYYLIVKSLPQTAHWSTPPFKKPNPSGNNPFFIKKVK